MTFNQLENQIEMWGLSRGIVQNAKPMGQAIKTLEEVTELLDALNRKDEEATTDAIGDVAVTLLMICAMRGVPFVKCLGAAYEQIKDRRGYLRPDGVFVKEAA